MTLRPFIIHLTEVNLKIRNKSEKRIVAKFLSILDSIDGLSIPPSQEEEIIRYIDSLQLKTYRGGNKRVIKRKLDSLTDYLKTEHSLIPEGHYLHQGIILGPGFGLAAGASLATLIGLDIPIGMAYGLITGMVVGIFVGFFTGQAAKKNGKIISIVTG